jgi:hypothetical protein
MWHGVKAPKLKDGCSAVALDIPLEKPRSATITWHRMRIPATSYIGRPRNTELHRSTASCATKLLFSQFSAYKAAGDQLTFLSCFSFRFFSANTSGRDQSNSLAVYTSIHLFSSLSRYQNLEHVLKMAMYLILTLLLAASSQAFVLFDTTCTVPSTPANFVPLQIPTVYLIFFGAVYSR